MGITKNDFLVKLFSVLGQAEIDYFVMGNYKSLPLHTGESDLDIIVKSDFICTAKGVLYDLLLECKVNVVSFYSNSNGFFYRLIGKDNEYWGLQLDLFYKGFFYHELEYFPLDEIRDDIIIYRGIRVLSENKANFVSFLKETVHNGFVKEKYIVGFIDEILSDRGKYEKLLQKLYGDEFVSIVLKNTSLSDLRKKIPVLKKLIQNHICKNKYDVFLNTVSKIKNLKRCFCQPGYTVAFLGTDGSGKSTIINNITSVFEQSFHNSVYYEHMRPNWLPSISHLLTNKSDFNGPVTNPHAKEPSGFFGSVLRFAYYLIDYSVGYFVKVFYRKNFKSCLWVFDRYYYDYLIDPKRARTKLPKWFFEIGQHLIPEPDLIICLGADYNVIYKRKPELPLLEIRRQVMALDSFCKRHDRTFWIDTASSVQQSTDEVLQLLSEYMVNRVRSANVL